MATNSLVSPTGKPITLKPVRANAGIQADYRKKLEALIADMNDSIIYWLSAAYKANSPVALDEAPALAMRRAVGQMASRWQKNFDRGAENLALWFAQRSKNYADVALTGILKEAGFSVEFKMTPAVQDAYQAVIGEQVGLIRSIASQHLTQVQTVVMQSVQQGRDLGALTKQLQVQFGVTKRRAAFIARDQSNKATATITKTRQQGLGITQARWRHSSAGKEPRPSHVRANDELYDINKGMYLDGEWVWPGTAINCRCTSSPVIPGFIR
jgi:SPP1 gp7 family putative phage head morphogenesis protein